jgi:hypothetical protein
MVKEPLMKASVLVALACCAAWSGVSAQAAAPINLQVSITPRSTLLQPGESAWFNLHVTSDSNATWLSGSVSLHFDAELLELSHVSLGTPFDLGGSLGLLSIEDGVGTLSDIGFSSATGIAGGFDIAAVQFIARSSNGYSTLRPFESIAGPFAWTTVSGESSVFSAIPGSVSVVPEPQSAALMLLGLGVLLCSAQAAGLRRGMVVADRTH